MAKEYSAIGRWGDRAVIFAIPICLVAFCRSNYSINGEKYRVLTAMFLDPSTDTYSLTRLQFYLWTGAALFGYIYLTISLSIIQGVFEFAPIPENLPGILFISASTAALSQTIKNNRGSAGSGEVLPTPADFVTSGGVIAPEKFQFLVWTITGVLAFVSLIAGSNPADIRDLPAIPNGFLYLMGISSFGFLGGQLARKAGPIIDEVRADITSKPRSLVLTLRGQQLSKEASFRIDDVPITPDMLVSADARPTVKEEDSSGAEKDRAKILGLVIAKPIPAWITPSTPPKDHNVTIVNPDGQQAVWPYKL